MQVRVIVLSQEIQLMNTYIRKRFRLLTTCMIIQYIYEYNTILFIVINIETLCLNQKP